MSKGITVITVARKPLSEGSVAENVLKWETGGLNIDAVRLRTTVDSGTPGRWPTNLVLQHLPGSYGCPVVELDQQSGVSASPPSNRAKVSGTDLGRINDDGWEPPGCIIQGYADEGGASRYFKQVKGDDG